MSVRVELTVTNGVDKGKTYQLENDHVVIGRNRASFILADKKISGQHCKVRVQGERVWLEDMGSTNGTFISGRRLTEPCVLNNLDEFTVGLTRISVAIFEDVGQFRDKNRADDFNDLSESDDFEPTAYKTGFEPSQDDDTRALKGPVSQKPAQKPTPTAAGRDKTPVSIKSKVQDVSPFAKYRHTGIARIDTMIAEEMEAFSKWDHPAIGNANEPSLGGMVKVKVILKVRKGSEGHTEFVCTKTSSTLGRKESDIQLNDIDCSRKHASIEIVQGDQVFIRDLASTNGTFVNGKRVAYQELKETDLIQIGGTVLEVTIAKADK